MRDSHAERSHRRLLRHAPIGVIVVTVLALALPAAPSAGAEVVFTFQGGGYGHSVGMSQYGAYGMALDGYSWEEILSHYFTGATPADLDPALAAAPLWVGLTQEQTRLDLTVIATGASPAVPVTFTLGTDSITAATGDRISIQYMGSGTCRVTGPAGTLEGPCSIDAAWDGWSGSPSTALEFAGCTLPDWNAPGGTIWRPCRYARGTLHIRPDNNTATFDVSLEIGVEDYILGISESPYAWGQSGGQAALEAQAVASRSYALHRAIERGDPASRPWCWCQLYDTTVDQFYVGWGHGTRGWMDAVAATGGKVMVHPSETRDGVLIPIETFYSSSTFGWTEDSENGFTSYVPYLRAVDDHWSRLAAAGNPNARWTASFSAADLAARLPGLSTVTGASVTKCSATGAALEITFTGQGGPVAFSTRDLRGRLNLRSMQVYNVGAPPSAVPPCSGPALDPPTPGGPVVLASLSVDDDASGDSLGDSDGVAECGETVEALTTLTDQGAALDQVGATLSSADPYVSIRWNTASSFVNLAAGGSAANLDDWDLVISPQAPVDYTAHLALQVTSANGGPWDLDVALPVSCDLPEPTGGPVVLASLNVDDDASGDSLGDSDGVAECGETVEALTIVTNQGPALREATGTLTSADPYVTIAANSSSPFPGLEAGASAAPSDDWDLVVSPNAPNGYTAHLALQVTSANGGPWDLDVALPVSCSPPTDQPAVLGTLLTSDPLRRGSRGSGVNQLQGFLKVKGYLAGAVDGVFGRATEAAVRAFQRVQSLQADGVVGSATIGAISNLAAQPGFASMADTNGRVLRLGTRGTDVAELQRFLAARGYRVGRIDGIFGSATQAAVRSFQAAARVPVDGQVGPATRLALLEALSLVTTGAR
jgi:SpoIID/LytB domain protein